MGVAAVVGGIGQTIDVVGLAVEVGQIQHVAALLLGIDQRGHGGIVLVEAGIAQLRQSGLFHIVQSVQLDRIVVVDISQRPDVAGIVQCDKHICGAKVLPTLTS